MFTTENTESTEETHAWGFYKKTKILSPDSFSVLFVFSVVKFLGSQTEFFRKEPRTVSAAAFLPWISTSTRVPASQASGAR